MPDIVIRNEAGIDEVWPGVNTVRFLDTKGKLVSFTHGEQASELQEGFPEDGKYRVSFLGFDGETILSYVLDRGDDGFYPEQPPVKDGYEFVGWNYSLDDLVEVKTNIIVGSMWRMAGFESNDNVFRIRLRTGLLTAGVRWYGSGSNTFEIDWGDGSQEIITSTAYPSSETHAYNSPGDYTIRMRKVDGDGSYWFGISGSNTSSSACSCMTDTTVLMVCQISDDVKNIYSAAFSYCSGLASVCLPNTISKIGHCAFYHCKSLCCISIPISVGALENQAFYQCSSLIAVSLPPNCKSCDNSIFYYCYSLKEFSFPYGIASSPMSCFQNCYSLTYVSIPETVKTIQSNCFSECSCLISVTTLKNVTQISSSAFSSCYSLRDLVLPDILSAIESNAFQYCHSLQEITLPYNLASISSYCFRGCKNLRKVQFANPLSIITIGSGAFSECYVLREIVIPESVKVLNNSCFSNCYSIREMVIPKSVNTIENNVFGGCTGLKEVFLLPDTVPLFSGGTPFSNNNTLRIHVPAKLLDQYKQAQYIKNNADLIVGDL